MTKRDLNMLERIFDAEINNRLLFQSKSKHLLQLEQEGMVEQVTRSLGKDRFGAITVSGWALTDLGRLTYCESCPPIEGE